MQRISAWTKLVTALGLFRYGTITGGVAPTPLKAEWLNMVQEELANFILAYLPELDAEDNTQLLKAIQVFGERYPVKATTLAGYGIIDAYTKPEADWLLSKKANNAITLAGYGIGDAYTKQAVEALLAEKQALIDQLAKTKQDKNTALMAATGWHLDSATGLLEQWGSGFCNPDSTTGAIDFPRPFAEVYNCFGNKITPNHVDSDGNAAGARALSATQYQLFNDTATYSATIHWRAIGKAPGF
ncbi:phage tail protein [Pseudomonas helleri]|uniref:gp53-like domain-containing protein n=1 Tax=Pseudomonas helleri TaxID=1608996 RepID=UPI0028EF58AD|nr:phage tail protein [Pseudomonas helleri]